MRRPATTPAPNANPHERFLAAGDASTLNLTMLPPSLVAAHNAVCLDGSPMGY